MSRPKNRRTDRQPDRLINCDVPCKRVSNVCVCGRVSLSLTSLHLPLPALHYTFPKRNGVECFVVPKGESEGGRALLQMSYEVRILWHLLSCFMANIL